MQPSLLLLSLVASFATAMPAGLQQRNDVDPAILAGFNFALALEHIEATFYAEALDKFSEDDFNNAGLPGVRRQVVAVAQHEAEHVKYLTETLQQYGATPIEASEYSFPYTDVKSFIGLAGVIEGVGTAAYLGLTSAVSGPNFLELGGSILAIEARHDAFLRAVQGYLATPASFETPLPANLVASIASGFFVPGAPNQLPVAPLPALTLEGSPKVGEAVVLKTDAKETKEGDCQVYCVFLSQLDVFSAPYDRATESCVVPELALGQNYVVLSTDVTVNGAVAGPAVVELDVPATGTTLVF